MANSQQVDIFYPDPDCKPAAFPLWLPASAQAGLVFLKGAYGNTEALSDFVLITAYQVAAQPNGAVLPLVRSGLSLSGSSNTLVQISITMISLSGRDNFGEGDVTRGPTIFKMLEEAKVNTLSKADPATVKDKLLRIVIDVPGSTETQFSGIGAVTGFTIQSSSDNPGVITCAVVITGVQGI